MTTSTFITSREFNQDTSGAKKAAQAGPVFITDRGRPAHVLISIELFEKLRGDHSNIVELLAMNQADQADFEPPRAGRLYRPAEFEAD